MSEERAIRDYFGRPGFHRFLKRLERQYSASREGIRGYVSLSNIEPIEREALDGFYRQYSPPKPGETKRYSIKKFERLLLESRYELTIPRLLEIMNGGPVVTRGEQESRTAAEWSGMIRRALQDFKIRADAGIEEWTRGLDIAEGSLSQGYRTLRLVFNKSRQEADQCLRFCLAALCQVRDAREVHLNGNDNSEEKRASLIRLPVLSAAITGDAHALDWKYPLGRLFWWGLTSISGGGAPTIESEDQLELAPEDEASFGASSRAMTIREGYRLGGVADDDLSSQVMLYAPELFGSLEERVLTLRQVEQLTPDRLSGLHCSVVHMVENPAVFAELMDADVRGRQRAVVPGEAAKSPWIGAPIIVCGNGRPSVAVLRLLDLLHDSRNSLLHYSGDMDAGGLGIAQGLKQRYPKAFRAWRMDAAQYRSYADRGVSLDAGERARLAEQRIAWDEGLVSLLLEKGMKLHQELWIEELLEDLLSPKGAKL